jgi:CBS domain containing-hemolysin-like protein
LSAIFILVLLNGFFVGAEFALVRARRTRLESMTRNGDRLARLVLNSLCNIPKLLSASQLGVTLSSLALGWVAKSILEQPVADVFARLELSVAEPFIYTLGAVVAIAAVAILHVVFGELIPKAAASNFPEHIARFLIPVLILFAWISAPLVWIINRISQIVLKLLNQDPMSADDNVHSPEELRQLVEQSQESGALEDTDAEMIEAVFEFSEKSAKEVMTPRTEIVAIPVEATLPEILKEVTESGLSRYPIYEETIDDILGLILTKDLLTVIIQNGQESFSIKSVMRPVHVIPGSRKVEDVLADFKKLKEHMAIVLDEYGGTAGIITMEDLLEEIVGEILDEHDEPEDEAMQNRAGETLVPGSMHIGELNEHFSLEVPDEEYTTIGGYIFGTLGRLPLPGDRVMAGGAIFTVRAMDGRRVDALAVDLHTLGDRRESVRIAD